MKTYKDVFVEDMVLRHKPALAAATRIGSVLAGLILLLAFYYIGGLLIGSYINSLFPLIFVLICVGIFMVFRNLRVEYEYSFFSGVVDIDRINGKRKRTRVLSFSCSDIELMAPCGPEYDKELSGNCDHKLDVRGIGKVEKDWFIICRVKDRGKYIIAFSPSERMLDAFRQYVRASKIKNN